MSWRETTLYTCTSTVLITVLGMLVTFILVPFEVLFCWRWPQKGHLLKLGIIIRRLWAKSLLLSYGIRVQAEGPGLNSTHDGCVLVGNHQSLLDIPILCAAHPKAFAFFSKKELLYIPFFGWVAWLCGTVYVDRKKGVRDDNALHAIRSVLRNGGSVAIFPEGTRSKDGKLGVFKRGAFVMAIETEAPILPFVILGSGELLPKGRFATRSGEARVWIGEPISTKGMSSDDRFALAKRVHDLVSNRLDLRP